jgi:RND family efflux transporter MFP subunit
MSVRSIWFVAGVLTLASLSGCQNKADAKGLPPPTGSALGAPAVPTLSELGAPSENRSSGSRDAAFVATGTLHPASEAQLGPASTGILTHIYVNEGDRVKKNQILFRLDPTFAALSIQQAEAAVQAADVGVKAAELDYQRTKELHDRGSIAPATYDQMKARYDASAATLVQAKAALSMARKAGGDTVVKSPIDGVVTMKLKNVGELATMMPPTIVVIVQDVYHLELKTDLPDRALVNLEPGVIVRAAFPAMNIVRDVPILRINPAVNARTRTVSVVAAVDNSDGKLKPGMLAEVTLDAKKTKPEEAAVASPSEPVPSAPAKKASQTQHVKANP